MLTDVIDQNLTEAQWDLVHKIAKELVLTDTDVNVLQKAIAYLRSVAHHENAVERFFKYLSTLASRQGQQVAHSKRTQDYHRNLNNICSRVLRSQVSEITHLLQILGWAARLTKYYKNAGPIGEEASAVQTMPVAEESERQRKIRAAIASETIAVGQKVSATIRAIKGNKVTYELLGAIKLTQKEPKKATSLKKNQVVNVQITQITDDGVPRKVRFID